MVDSKNIYFFSKKNKFFKKKKVVLLTGASSGLGLALAKKLIKEDQYYLVLTARSSSIPRFDTEGISLAKNVWIQKIDTVDHTQITNVVNFINSNLGGVDILINNAGICERSTVEDSDDSCRQRQLDVNYLAPFELIAQVLPSMREKRSGRIINVSSASGFMAMPTMSAYSASKFALEAASESLWYEMKPWGIFVTLIIPGFINSLGYLHTTESLHGQVGALDSESAYYEHYRCMRSFVAHNMMESTATNESTAYAICKVMKCRKPPLRKYISSTVHLLFWIRKLMPARTYHAMMFRLLPNVRAWGLNKFKETPRVRYYE